MLRRKMSDRLVKWKNAHNGKCLLINGARQVGKSFIVDRFGEDHYTSYIKIDFVEHPEYRSIFEGSLSAERIYSNITLVIPEARILPGATLLFFDELQECPNARASFKYLAQDGRCDVIGSGSLLGMRFRSLAEAPSLPVGYEEQITMRPLDFEEFLWAHGYDEQAVMLLKQQAEDLIPMSSAAHETMMRLLREYLAVGGMPAVVQAFCDGWSFKTVHEEQLALHALYLDDIARYAEPSQRVKARACYLSLPRQLAKENTKFQYAAVEKGGSSRKFNGSVDWLVGSEMALRCQCVSTPQYPLAAYEDESRFRLYANDTGLLMAMYDFGMKAAVVENTLRGPMKGGLYENLVACMLAAKGDALRYWMSASGDREIEFLIERDGAVAPVEVKASRGSTVSLDEVLERKDIHLGYKLIDGNVGRADKTITLPLYMALFV